MRTTNTYLALKTFGAHVAGDRFKANEQIGAKLIRQGLASLVDDYDNEQVQLRWKNECLEVYNRQTGRVLLRIPPGGITVLPVDIIGNVTGNADTATRATAADTATRATAADNATKAERVRKTTAPTNAKAAAQTIGSLPNGKVTVTAAVKGAAGNDLAIIVSDAGANDCAMTASIAAGVITVTLGKTGAFLDPTKNTASLVAAAIDSLTEVTAVASGTGGASLVAAEASQNFVGGQDGTEGYEGEIVMDASRIYLCTADNTINDANWIRSDTLSTF